MGHGSDGHEIFRRTGKLEGLGIAPAVDDRGLMDTGDRAVRSAGLFGEVFAADILDAVLLERNARIAALLRTVVNQAVLADVQISAASAAAPPVIGLARDQILLIRIVLIDPGVRTFGEISNLLVDAALPLSKR